MKRFMAILPLLTLTASGCALVSSSPAASSAASSPSSAYEAMSSTPPEAPKEEQPKLEEKQIWVPGYYEPVAGTWIWHTGQATTDKSGYRLVPASYREEGGKVFFAPPRWRRADLAVK